MALNAAALQWYSMFQIEMTQQIGIMKLVLYISFLLFAHQKLTLILVEESLKMFTLTACVLQIVQTRCCKKLSNRDGKTLDHVTFTVMALELKSQREVLPIYTCEHLKGWSSHKQRIDMLMMSLLLVSTSQLVGKGCNFK